MLEPQRRTILAIHRNALARLDRDVARLTALRQQLDVPDAEKEPAKLQNLNATTRTLNAALLDQQAYQEVIDNRTADERFSIVIRRIGQPDDGKGDPDPAAWNTLEREDKTARFNARSRARKMLREMGEPTSEADIDAAQDRDPLWHKEHQAISHAWFLAGVVGGESEWVRVYQLGVETGGAEVGTALLIQSVEEIKEFNRSSAKKKSS